MSTKNDMGASHDFGKASKNWEKMNTIMKVSKTMYLATKHIDFIEKYANEKEISVSAATDLIIQRGIAYTHILEEGKNGQN